MIKIEATQGEGYGKHEYDLLDAQGYVGLMVGTETRHGLIWEVKRFRNGQFDGSIMRLPVMTFTEALGNAEIFTR